MKTVLVVDDEVFFRDRLCKALQKRDFTVFSAANYEEALSLVQSQKPDMGIFDLKMPGKNGLELLKDALSSHQEMKIIVLTGYGSIATAIDAVKMGALSYIAKPADVDDILNAFTKISDDLTDIDAENLVAPSLARTEWEHINRVLHDCDDNISSAAKCLGIHRRTLQRKLQKYPPKK
nr:response regulator [Desulfobulbaceae bacterium]